MDGGLQKNIKKQLDITPNEGVHPNFRAGYANMMKVIQTPRFKKVYKNAQYKEGVKRFGKDATIGKMKDAYGNNSKSNALNKKIGDNK